MVSRPQNRRTAPIFVIRHGQVGVIADGTPDSEVLQIAAEAGRVLVSRDVTTMPAQFEAFVSQYESPGLLLVPSHRSIGAVIEGLLIVWLTWVPEDLLNQARWLPSRAFGQSREQV